MPYALNKGVRIRYELEGSGPPLVLQHWSLATLEDWYDCGFVDLLKADYRLILIDARGHGRSDRPHDPAAYALSNRVADIVVVLDDLAIDRAHFFGYSMGGWIGFGVAKYAQDRFHSLVIGGQHPYESNMGPLREVIEYGLEHGMDAFIAHWEKISGAVSEERKTRIRASDLEALRAVAGDRDSLEEILPGIAIPCLLIVGEQDTVFERAKACASTTPAATFVSLPGLDHGGVLDRPELVVPHIRRFLSPVVEGAV
ncbi:alpha/beta fold hydrolase [Candidatus Bipolaricaulota bacterium]|nr:alpha/beta fold hydrolase [Candidatus Bipolaricaulota bacterium]